MKKVVQIICFVLGLAAPSITKASTMDFWLSNTASETSTLQVIGRTNEHGVLIQEFFLGEANFHLGGILACGSGAYLLVMPLEQLNIILLLPALRVIIDFDRSSHIFEGDLARVPEQPFLALVLQKSALERLLILLRKAEWITFEFRTISLIGDSPQLLRHRTSFQPQSLFTPCWN